MLLKEKLPWADPISIARQVAITEKFFVLLCSGLRTSFTGRYSILAMNAKQHIKSSDFEEFAEELSGNSTKWQNAWFGYLGYGLKNKLEKLPSDIEGLIKMPDLWMTNYQTILIFDHDDKIIELWQEKDAPAFNYSNSEDTYFAINKITLNSNMTRQEYLAKVQDIREAIAKGDLYQANLTRKFFGEINLDGNPFEIFYKLYEASPAPYSAFFKYDDTCVISSSPEQFVSVDENGLAKSRPITGSAPRFADEYHDQESKHKLSLSDKDKAENLMIVDLVRNDFSRSCEVGSVKVESLFDISSYATVHHMSSTISGQKRKEVSTLELIKNCFPPGSMTGTPKIKAMEVCTELEKMKRGIYSGAIGWFGGDGAAELSVVIRTLIVQGNKYEFQTGGAITIDSDPEKEWEETLLKAKAIAEVLGIERNQIEKL